MGPKAGAIDPKTRKSRRRVPVPAVFRALLAGHRLRRGSPAADDLVFAPDGQIPFQAERLCRLADQAWKKSRITGRLRLHQSRHTYASFLIAAGVNAKALSSFMGHPSITVAFDLYGHLMPATEAEGAALLDAFLEDPEADEDAA